MERFDITLLQMEEDINEQDLEIERLRQELGELRNKELQHSQRMIANTLMALTSTPEIETIGPVGATIIARIRDMETIEQVKEYINELTEKYKQEKEN